MINNEYIVAADRLPEIAEQTSSVVEIALAAGIAALAITGIAVGINAIRERSKTSL